MRFANKHKIFSALCVPILALSAEIHAQVLEEVIVTAQKREQSLQDIGVAVTAYTGDQLEALGYDNAQQITAQSPGVTTIQPNGPSAFFLSIRGVAQNDFSGDHQESPVAIYIDEAYISAASGAGFQLFDMERAEILRGPQGTLFGRNATGGLAHYITKKPSDEIEGYVDLTMGDYDQVVLEGAMGGPITDSVSGRISFLRNEHDGYIDNRIGTDLNNGDDWAVRGHLQFDINEDVSWLLTAKAAEQDINSGFFKHSAARQNLTTGLGEHFSGADLQGGGDSLAASYQDSSSDVHSGEYNLIGHNKLETSGLTSNIQWQMGELDVALITDYFSLKKDYIEDSDASPNDFFAFYLKSDLDQFSQEIRVSGSTDSLQWVGGIYYLNIDGNFENGGAAGNFFGASFPGFGLGGTNIGLYSPFSTDTDSVSVFGQAEYTFREDLTLIAGLRWTKEKKEANFIQYAAEFSSPATSDVVGNDFLGIGGALFTFNATEVTNDPGGTAFGFPLVLGNPGDAKKDDDLITAKLGLNWQVSEETLIYANYNRGIKGGGFNAPLDATNFYDGDPSTGGPDDMAFDEEVLNAYETGFKRSFADGKARLNATAYYYDYQDYQAFSLEGLTTFVFNTDAETYGGEIELQVSASEGLDIIFGASYIDNTVEDAYRLPSGEAVDRVAVMTPEWSFNGLARYEWAAMGGKLAVQADFNYLDDHYFQLKNSPVGQEDAYTLVNARVTYTSGNGNWNVAAFLDNATDEEYRTMVFDLAGAPSGGGFGLAENYYGTPRWWGVTLGYNW
tara:strand:+ start:749 stop:3112 length:2364 start_codon:yes stop_codon:yes gene_type:complete